MRDALSSGNMNLGTRMGSVKSAHRRAGKVKGIERFLGTLETQSQELMETSSGQAFPQIYCIQNLFKLFLHKRTGSGKSAKRYPIVKFRWLYSIL